MSGSLAARRSSLALAAVALLGAGCGTGASSAGGDRDLPTAMAGPFRLLRKGETGNTAPFVLDRSAPWEAPSALDLDGDPATPAVALYVSWGATLSAISRYEAPDGITAGKTVATVVLAGDEDWEKPSGVGHPSVLRVGDEVWLYYAAGGCLGRAVSTDNGVTFTRSPSGPMLCAGPAWEGGALTAPGVHVGFDGRFHLLYGAAGAIGEAVSDDGVTFARVGEGPVLSASGVDFDAAAVGEPCVVTTTSPLGRPITMLYYSGHTSSDPSTDRLATGLAGRFGDTGPFERSTAPVLTRNDAHGPSVLRRGDVTVLYAAGRSSEVPGATWKSVIVGGVAPADRSLPTVE